VLKAYWDHKSNAVTHKIEIPGTSRYLLFSGAELAALREEINAALEGADHARAT
jgi:hypothetical protein